MTYYNNEFERHFQWIITSSFDLDASNFYYIDFFLYWTQKLINISQVVIIFCHFVIFFHFRGRKPLPVAISHHSSSPSPSFWYVFSLKYIIEGGLFFLEANALYMEVIIFHVHISRTLSSYGFLPNWTISAAASPLQNFLAVANCCFQIYSRSYYDIFPCKVFLIAKLPDKFLSSLFYSFDSFSTHFWLDKKTQPTGVSLLFSSWPI